MCLTLKSKHQPRRNGVTVCSCGRWSCLTTTPYNSRGNVSFNRITRLSESKRDASDGVQEYSPSTSSAVEHFYFRHNHDGFQATQTLTRCTTGAMEGIILLIQSLKLITTSLLAISGSLFGRLHRKGWCVFSGHDDLRRVRKMEFLKLVTICYSNTLTIPILLCR